MKAVIWESEGLGANYHDEDIPADMVEAAEAARHYMVENAVELDDEAMESYLNGDEVTIEVINGCLRKAVLNGAFYPILCGSSVQEQGRVQPLLDAVVEYPHPRRWTSRRPRVSTSRPAKRSNARPPTKRR